MRNCVVCEEISSYECTFCKQFLCKVHRIEHHQIQAEHKFEKIRTKLTAQNTKRLKKVYYLKYEHKAMYKSNHPGNRMLDRQNSIHVFACC